MDAFEMPDYADELSQLDVAMLAAYLRQQRFAHPDTGALRGTMKPRARERVQHHREHHDEE